MVKKAEESEADAAPAESSDDEGGILRAAAFLDPVPAEPAPAHLLNSLGLQYDEDDNKAGCDGDQDGDDAMWDSQTAREISDKSKSKSRSDNVNDLEGQQFQGQQQV